MSQRLNFKLMCHDCAVIYLHIPTGVTNGTVIHCSQCKITLGTWGVLRADFVTQGACMASLSWMKGKSYAGNDRVRIDFDDDANGRPSSFAFYVAAIIFIAGLVLVGAIGWELS